MSSYDRIRGKLAGKGADMTYTVNYREDKPLPAFLGGGLNHRLKDMVFEGEDEIRWLAQIARQISDKMMASQGFGGKLWLNFEGPKQPDGRHEANCIVRDAIVTLRDGTFGLHLSLAFGGIDWIADHLKELLPAVPVEA